MLGLHCRHETPVLSKPIDVIHLSEDLVVLDKPCSLPVSVENILINSVNFICFFAYVHWYSNASAKMVLCKNVRYPITYRV